MNERDKILTELAAASFAVTESGLYLDTHPGDRTALDYKMRYAREERRLRAEYEERFGPLSAIDSGDADCWEWTATPFPWVREGGVR